jgi:hypothetical protein
MDDNVLGKRMAAAREWSFRQIRRFYSLDPSLWSEEAAGRPCSRSAAR